MDAYQSDMVWLSRISEAEIERVLAGEYTGEDPSLHALTTYAQDAKATFSPAPDEATRAIHLMAMAETAAGLDRLPPSEIATAPSRPFSGAKVVFSSLIASLIGKIALVSVAVAATTGGLAATGSLPDPAQDALARAAEEVGFDLPASDDRGSSDNDAGVPEDLPDGAQGSSAPSVLDVIRSWDDDKGCEFGHTVATAAGGHPDACKDEQGDDEGSKNTKHEARRGRPEGAGKPEGTPQEKPAGAGEGQGGKPEGTPDDKPEGAGKPEAAPGGGSDRSGETDSGSSDHGDGHDSGGVVAPPSDVPAGGSGVGLPNSLPGAKP